MDSNQAIKAKLNQNQMLCKLYDDIWVYLGPIKAIIVTEKHKMNDNFRPKDWYNGRQWD